MPRLPSLREFLELELDASAQKTLKAYQSLLQDEHKRRQDGWKQALQVIPQVTNGLVALGGLGAILAICFKFGGTKPEFAQAIAGMILTFAGGFAAGKAEKSLVRRAHHTPAATEDLDESDDTAGAADES